MGCCFGPLPSSSSLAQFTLVPHISHLTPHYTNMSENETKSAEAEISLLDLLIVIAKHKKSILRNTVVAFIASLVVSLLLPKVYTATTAILPPQQGQSTAAAMLGQLGGLAGVAGASLGIKDPSDLYIGMLKSRTVEDSLIKRFDLQRTYQKKYMADARKLLENNSKISAGKDGIIALSFDDKDPKRAADIANAYVDELNKLTSSLAVTEASQRRLFFEKQLNVVRDNLAKAEYDLQKIQGKTGLIQDYPQEKEIAESNARLRAEIASKEVQLSAMQIGVTQRNPEFLRLQQEIASLKDRLKGADAEGLMDSGMSERGIEYIQKFRDVKYNETVMEMLFKQYELAKIDEAKDYPLIQVLDKAVPPERKSKPKRAVIVVLYTLLGFVLSVIWVFFSEAKVKARLDPGNVERFSLLRRYISWK